MYLTFDEFVELGGRLQEMPFNLLEFEARKEIDKHTFGRIQALEEQCEDVKKCMFKLIEILSKNNDNKSIKSETIDGYSVSYDSAIDDTQSIIKTYLVNCKLEDGTPYLYRGIK